MPSLIWKGGGEEIALFFWCKCTFHILALSSMGTRNGHFSGLLSIHSTVFKWFVVCVIYCNICLLYLHSFFYTIFFCFFSFILNLNSFFVCLFFLLLDGFVCVCFFFLIFEYLLLGLLDFMILLCFKKIVKQNINKHFCSSVCVHLVFFL